jgi:hypothetical protein
MDEPSEDILGLETYLKINQTGFLNKLVTSFLKTQSRVAHHGE